MREKLEIDWNLAGLIQKLAEYEQKKLIGANRRAKTQKRKISIYVSGELHKK
jgi:hypothetical protein